MQKYQASLEFLKRPFLKQSGRFDFLYLDCRPASKCKADVVFRVYRGVIEQASPQASIKLRAGAWQSHTPTSPQGTICKSVSPSWPAQG